MKPLDIAVGWLQNMGYKIQCKFPDRPLAAAALAAASKIATCDTALVGNQDNTEWMN